MKRSSKSHKRSTKILALVLSLLMLLGAMPIAMAATLPYAPVEEWPTLPEGTEIIVGQQWKNFEFVGGKSSVPGHFEHSYPENTPYVIKDDGTTGMPLKYIPDDTTAYRTKMKVVYVKARKADNPTLEGTATATILEGKPLSEAVITKSDDFGVKSYDTLFKTKITWETPDKIMSTVGTSAEKATVFACTKSGSPMKENAIDSFPIDINVVVESAENYVEVKEVPVASPIKVGQTLADSKLTGGIVTKGYKEVPGTFAWKDPTIVPTKGAHAFDVVFTPTDPEVCPQQTMQVYVTADVAAVKAAPTASDIEVGQTLADSKLTGGRVAIGNVDVSGTWAWKDPTIAPAYGTSQQTVVFTPDDQSLTEPLETQATIETNQMTVVELPTYEGQLIPGTKFGDYPIKGGLVTKGGKPVSGTWTWGRPDDTIEVGTYNKGFNFKPDNPEDGYSIYTVFSLTVEKIPLEITWAEDATAVYKAGAEIRDCISLSKIIDGKANIPGTFRTTYESTIKTVPASINETMEITVYFDPVASAYATESHIAKINFEPVVPTFSMSVRSDAADSANVNVDYTIYPISNWSQHTGKFYLVVDGERTELTEASSKLALTGLSGGYHTFYCEYVEGANDVYKSAKSDERQHEVVKLYSVVVNDSAGTTTVGRYRAGYNVAVKAAAHEKPYYVFDKWTVEGTPLPEGTDTTQQEMTFVMPDGDVKLTATYKFDFGTFLKLGFQKVVGWLIEFIPQVIEFVKGLFPQQ